MRAPAAPILVAIVIGAVVLVTIRACSASSDGDRRGQEVRSALASAVARGRLHDHAVHVATLAPFDWDRVQIVPEYQRDRVRPLIGDAADDLPNPAEGEALLVFIRDGDLAGWLRLDHDASKTIGLDLRCLYADNAIKRHAARLIETNGRLMFADRRGRPVTPLASCR